MKENMCTCRGIIPQSQKCYNQMVNIKIPKNIEIRYNNHEQKKKDCISVDPCLLGEIKLLLAIGIVTTGCCCGHNTHISYIGVKDKYIEKMKNLGYEVQPNAMYPDRQDSFKPFSIRNNY